jgi:hypothetical protein
MTLFLIKNNKINTENRGKQEIITYFLFKLLEIILYYDYTSANFYGLKNKHPKKS